MKTVKVIPKIDWQLNRVMLFFTTKICWACAVIPYLRINCWCEAEGYDECCLERMQTDYHAPETLAEEIMIETALNRYRAFNLRWCDKVIVRKRLSKQEINRAQ